VQDATVVGHQDGAFRSAVQHVGNHFAHVA
jgi:hypothetical protein